MVNLVFDIGGVLINFNVEELVRDISRRTGVPEDRLAPVFTEEAQAGSATGRITGRRYFERQVRPLIPAWTYEDLIGAWMDNYSLNQPGWELMLEARERAGEVYILSNLSEFNQLAIERKFPRFFTYATRNFYSYELGCLKPHPEIFTKARAQMTHRDRSTILLDDMPVNIEGARSAGWGGVCFNPTDIGKIREQILFMIEQEKKLQQSQ